MTTPSEMVEFGGGKAGALVGTHGLTPQSASELWKIAENIADAGIVPYDLRGKPADIFIIMATGMEYGFPLMASLSLIYVVKGKPAMSYEAILAKMHSHPQMEYVRITHEGAGEERAAVIITKRRGRPENDPIRFTVAQARQARLYDEKWRDKNGEPSVWVKYTDDMLVAKVVARSKRRDWADLLPGLQVREDLEESPRMVNVTPARQRPEQSGPDPIMLEMQREGIVAPQDKDPEPVEIREEPSVVFVGEVADASPLKLAELTKAIKWRVEKEVKENPDLPRIAYGNALRKAIAARYPDLTDEDDRLYDAVLDAERMEIVVQK